MNLGNALDAPDEGQWGVTLDASYFKMLADSGFKNVRIPARWDKHLLETTTCTVDPIWMARVKWAVSNAIGNGLIAVLDQHHYDPMNATPLTLEPCFNNIWKQIDFNLKDFSTDSLVLEIMNEPQDSLLTLTDLWNSIQGRTIDTLRAMDPNRTLMIGGVNYNSASGLAGIKLRTQDVNVIATFHDYEPFTFTHQGATFVSPVLPTGVTWSATPAQMRTARATFDIVSQWSTTNNVPIYMGEFGSFNMADSASRPIWTEFMATEAISRGFAFAYWEFCSGFGIYDAATNIWHTDLVDALLHPSRGFGIVRPSLDTTSFVVFDDFDGVDGKFANVNSISTALMLKAGLPLDSARGSWYAYNNDSSSILKGDNTPIQTQGYMLSHGIDTATNKPDFYNMITTGGHTSRGLHAKMKLIGSTYPYVGIGSSFNGNTTTYNLSSMKALSFWAKGYGTFKVGWNMAFSDTCCSDNWGKFSKEITLTNDWTQYTIWADQWTPSPWSALETAGYEWVDHNKAVRELQFSSGQSYGQVVNDSLEIYLDDVRMYGMNKSAFGY